MNRPKPNAERDRQIVAKAHLGQTHESLAAEFGITRARVGQICAAANPVTPAEAQRAEIAKRYRAKWDELQAIVNTPPAKTTAIGKTVTDPDTGKTVRNMSVVVAAIREQLKIETVFRGMFGIDLAARPGPVFDEQSLIKLAENRVAQQYRIQQAPLPPLAPLPDNYRALSPEDQAAADLERRRTQLAALPAPRLEVVQGEIVD